MSINFVLQIFVIFTTVDGSIMRKSGFFELLVNINDYSVFYKFEFCRLSNFISFCFGLNSWSSDQYKDPISINSKYYFKYLLLLFIWKCMIMLFFIVISVHFVCSYHPSWKGKRILAYKLNKLCIILFSKL